MGSLISGWQTARNCCCCLVAKLCLTHCDPMDCSPPDSSVHGICSSDGKESACNAGDPSLIPGSGRSPGEGNGSPLPSSCPENPMHRGAWRGTVHSVTKSQTGLSDCYYRQDYWSGSPFPPPGDLPDPGIEPTPLSSHWQLGSLPLSHQRASREQFSKTHTSPG